MSDLIPQSVKTLGYEISVLVPSTVEQYDKLAGRSGSCLESAVMNVIYRSVLAEFRDTFTEKLAAATGIERRTVDTGKKRKVKTENADGSITETEEAILVWDDTDSEAQFTKRVIATLMSRNGTSEEETYASFQELASSVAAGILFNPAERVAASAGPKKIAKQYLDAATAIIAKGAAEAVAAKLSALLNRAVASDLNSLAAAISDDQRRKAKELANSYTA